MSLYQKIKSAITVRQVGEMYGMEPDRHGMVCCPFHSDNHPSMMLNESYYYCFACGANGDAIDLTAKLFDLNPRQAAEKLIIGGHPTLVSGRAASAGAERFPLHGQRTSRRYNLEATNNIYLPGGRRVRGFVGIEPLVHPCP